MQLAGSCGPRAHLGMWWRSTQCQGAHGAGQWAWWRHVGCTLRCVLCHSWALTSHGWLNFPPVATFSICLCLLKQIQPHNSLTRDSYFTKDALGKWWWWFSRQVVSQSFEWQEKLFKGELHLNLNKLFSRINSLHSWNEKKINNI